MDLEGRLKLLAAAARYDVACAATGLRGCRGRRWGSPPLGVCHVWAEDGRTVSLLKVLLTNRCVNDCAYCAHRSSVDGPRTHFEPRELARLTWELFHRNYVEGLFLSSGVWRNPDHTMELMIGTARVLREEYSFPGYIHLKVIPGCDPQLVRSAAFYADRLSVNVELPQEESLSRLAPQKDFRGILGQMALLAELAREGRERVKGGRGGSPLMPAGHTTQLVVGASKDDDLTILSATQRLYAEFGLRRVYYSAFIPVGEDPRLPGDSHPPLRREHRLYQADWLIRFYGFRVEELLSPVRPYLDTDIDPKLDWALRHPDFFPVDVNRDGRERLLRVPGLGQVSASRILRARRERTLRWEDLPRLGVVMKRASPFLVCVGSPDRDVDCFTLSEWWKGEGRERVLGWFSGMERKGSTQLVLPGFAYP